MLVLILPFSFAFIHLIIKKVKQVKIKSFIMKIHIGSIFVILANNSVIVEGRLSRSNLNNGAQCTKSDQCKSKCCSKGSGSNHVCVKKESGSVCTEGNARIVPGTCVIFALIVHFCLLTVVFFVLLSIFEIGTSEDWTDAINKARKKYQEQYGGTYSELKWSNDLKTEAQEWANTIAARCQNGLPSGK